LDHHRRAGQRPQPDDDVHLGARLQAQWLASARGAGVVLHLAVVTTFLAYWLFGHGLRHTSAQTATTLTLAEPAVAAVLGVAALGERLPALSWCGLAVLAAGLAFLALPARR
ncbi:EamA family transporter, partial [Kitasatospora sp. NPDC091257]|uniref:EamA family transporter n=1 Tax=Kitasatospora sp. NPDC091257 TaxID=3364084 RepID=UPI0038133613